MTIKISAKANPKTKTIIIPLLAKSHLSNTLITLDKKYGTNCISFEKEFRANNITVLSFASKKGNYKVYLLKLNEALHFKQIELTFKVFAYRQKEQLSTPIAIDFNFLFLQKKSINKHIVIEAAVNGWILSTYQIGLYKTVPKKKTAKSITLELLLEKDKGNSFQKSINTAKAIAEAQLQILDLVNAPGNKVTPKALANWAKKSGKANGFKVRVLNKAQAKKIGLHALLAVNKGSEYPPAFIIMEYTPQKTGKKKLPVIGLVGKGVTFDTGGLSIKGSNNMHYMKSDMGGAAAVLGAMEVISKQQIPVKLIGIVPATDNCVDATAIMPGDVINSYSGKTIEIIDTDAEGRLILADGLAYLNKNYKTDVLIDLATLTGSTVQTLGYQAGGLFSNNNKLARALITAGEQTGERLWALPLWNEYLPDVQSDVADVRNYSGRTVAGAISAAKFLEYFIDNHPAWAHLDIAGVAFGNSVFSKQKSATAYGIRLLYQFVVNYI